MSKKSRQRKWRRVESTRHKEQLALREDTLFGEETEATIGQLVDRLAEERTLESNGIPLRLMPEPQSHLPVAPQATSEPKAQIKQIDADQPPPSLLPAEKRPKDWPDCPLNCDPVEWQLALEHHDYYLLKAMGTGKPWFQFPKFSTQYSEFVFITPEMAQELLDHMPINRKKKPLHVERLRRDILNHRWRQTHESVAINKLGNCHDGQHRAEGILKAGIGWPLYVTWNVPTSAIYVTDSGERRNENEKLALLFPELKVTLKTAALARALMGGLENRAVRYTGSEIAGFMFIHAKVMCWAMSRLRKYRADLQAVVAKSLLWWGEGVIGPFVERLDTVQFTGEGDPAKALYLWLQQAKEQGKRSSYVNSLLYYKKALAAIHAHAAGKEAKRITAKEQDIFEWLPGWKVPDSAPCKGNVFLDDEETTPTTITK